MITVVYGVPGSGKSYYAVHFIRRRCLEEGDIFFRVRSDVILITNLKLNLDATDGYIYIEDIKDFARYMDVSYWQANFSLLQGKKVYIVMDEAQLFFYHYKDDVRVMFFLQYHRHLGMDILLITQTPKSLPAKVFELAEFLIESVPRSVNPFSFRAFRYRVLHPFDRDIVLRRFHLAFDPVLFHLYSDMIYKPPEGEEEKPKNAFTRYYVLFAFLSFITVFLMFSFLSRVFSSPPTQFQTQTTLTSTEAITYEDLITEVPEEKPKMDYNPEPLGEKPKEEIKPEIKPKGYSHILVDHFSEVDLFSGPKVVELP